MSGFLTDLGVDIFPLISLSLGTTFPISIPFVTLIGLSLVDRLLGDNDEKVADGEVFEAGGDDEEAGEDDEFFKAGEDINEIGDDDFEDKTLDEEFDQDLKNQSTTSDLEPRLDELEGEVEGISSTISTVRSENEAIGESVEEVEDNVRKLLDIYEMVTRGVNPFVDDPEGQPFDRDSFGLFPPENSSGSEDGSVSDEVMDADADSFFDETFGDGGMDDGFDDGSRGKLLEGTQSDLSEDDEEGQATAKTFDDLKAEYEGEGDGWNDETDDEMVGFEFDNDDGQSSQDEEISDDVEDDISRGWIDTEENTDTDWTGDESAPVAANGGDPHTDDDDKPYLTEIPNGYSAELTVLEWMDYLRNHADTAETLRAIEYYQNIGWINEQVANDLTEIVMGFERNGHHSTGSEHNLSELTIENHTHSLQYVSQLDGGTVDMELVRNWPERGK